MHSGSRRPSAPTARREARSKVKGRFPRPVAPPGPATPEASAGGLRHAPDDLRDDSRRSPHAAREEGSRGGGARLSRIRQTLPAVASLLSSYGLLLLANGLFGTLIGVRTQIEGFSALVVGLIIAAYFVGLLTGALSAARFVSGVGHIRAFAAFASVMSVSALGIVLVVHPIAWALMRLLGGYCMAGMVMVTESWVNERCSNQTRGQVMAFYMITNYLAAGLGQFLLPLGDPAEFQLFCVASIIYSLALVPVLLTRASAPIRSEPRPLRFRALYRTSPLGFIAALGAGAVNSNFHGLGPVFAHDIGLSLTQTSTFMAAAIFGGLLMQWPAGRLSDAIDRRTVIAIATLGTACAGFAIALVAGRTNAGLFALVVLYGGFSFTVYSIAVAHTNDFADPAERVRTASGMLIAYGVGACFGPLLTSVTMGQIGPSGLFLLSGAVHLSIALFAFYRGYQRVTKAREERAPTINLPGGQFTSGVLYDRLRDEQERDLERERSDVPGDAKQEV